MNAQIESFLIEKSNGNTIFRIQMSNLDCQSWLDFTCTIDIDYNKNLEMKKTINEILSPETSVEKSMQLTQEILSQVTTIEGIKQCKKFAYATKHDRENDTFNKYLVDFTFKSEPKESSPFSLRKNVSLFKRFARRVNPHLSSSVEVERSLFEELIAGYPELEEEYVHYYSNEATFYILEAYLGDICYQYYIMYSNRVTFFFFRET